MIRILFVENFLKPILVQKSKKLEDEIEDINNEIIEQFGQNNQKRRAANTWKERMTKKFNCDECDFGTTNKIQLKTHINKKHMKIKSISSNKANRIITYLDSSPQPLKESSELLMIEDNTLDKEVIEEVTDNADTKEDQVIETNEVRITENLVDDKAELFTDVLKAVHVEIEDSTFYCNICARSFEVLLSKAFQI